MADEADGKIKYRRRLDRTPEKQFEKLPDAEKKLMSAMRGALENCRNKVDAMKNDLEEKEKTIEVERSRRKEAEERLKYLVDPYQSRDVNSELRKRLPRANKSDPLEDKKELESTDESEVPEQSATKSKSPKSNFKSTTSPGRGSQSKKKVRRTLNFHTPSTRASYDHADGDGEMDSSSEEDYHPIEPRSSHSRGKGRHSSDHPGLPPPAPPMHFPHYTGGVGYPLGQYATPYYRPLSLTPWSSMSSVNMFPSPLNPRDWQGIPGPSGITQSRSFPLLNGEKVGNLGPSGNAGTTGILEQKPPGAGQSSTHKSEPVNLPSHNAADHEAEEQTAGPAPQNPTSQREAVPSELLSHSASSMSSHYALPTSLATGGGDGQPRGPGPAFPHIGAPMYTTSPLATGVSTPYTDSSMRQTTVLHEEIGRLKEANKQLMETLTLRNQEVETLKLQILAETPSNATLDSDAAKKFAELMAEVKAAEKRREGSMEARVSQAEQDRERVMHDLESMPLNASEEKRSGRHLTLSDLSASESEDSEEEEEIRQHQFGTERQSAAVVNPDAGRVASLKDALKELEHRQQKQLQIYQEELQVVMEQRDQALEQLQAQREKVQQQQLRMPAQREQILMAKISALQREKDRAETIARQLKDEQIERHLFISLHKALFPDSAMNDSTQTRNTTDKKLPTKQVSDDDDDDGFKVKEKEDNQLLEQLRQASQERSLLQRRCEDLEAACRQEQHQKSKLERLNGVLRKKLIAISTGTDQLQEE